MRKYELTINNRQYSVHVRKFSSEEATLRVNGKTYTVKVDEVVDSRSRLSRKKIPAAPATPQPAPAAPAPKAQTESAAPSGGAAACSVSAPIPGAVLDVFVKTGDRVRAGDELLKLEAMKMENSIKSERNGTVASVHVSKGDSVAQGQELITLA